MTTPTTSFTPAVGQRFEKDGHDTWRDAAGNLHRHEFTQTLHVTSVDADCFRFSYDIIAVTDHACPPPAAIRRNYHRGEMLVAAVEYRLGLGQMREVTP